MEKLIVPAGDFNSRIRYMNKEENISSGKSQEQESKDGTLRWNVKGDE